MLFFRRVLSAKRAKKATQQLHETRVNWQTGMESEQYISLVLFGGVSKFMLSSLSYIKNLELFGHNWAGWEAKKSRTYHIQIQSKVIVSMKIVQQNMAGTSKCIKIVNCINHG